MIEPRGRGRVESRKVESRKVFENAAVYGWGYAGEPGSATRFYIQFGPKPVAVTYKLTVPMWDDSTDAYLKSYECARAARKASDKK